MTPEERKLVIDLFDRLAALEDAPRDPDAERLIRDGLRQAPNAVYPLVQTVLVQDEALKRANARIEELEGRAEEAPRDSSFLGGMRDTLLGRREGRGSVPSVRAGESEAALPGMSPAWRNTGGPGEPPGGYGPGPGYGGGYAPAPGGSFLGTAAASAAGVIGGSLLMSGIRNLMGHGGAHAAYDPNAGGSPWGGQHGSTAGGQLSRDAGIDDIGRAGGRNEGGHAVADQGHHDNTVNDHDADQDQDQDQDDGDFDDDDFDYDDDGGSDE